MNVMTGLQRSIPAILVVMLLVSFPGCGVIGGKYLFDEPLNKGHIDGIRRGATTGNEIVARFGPPEAIIRRGADQDLVGRTGFVIVQSDAVFELFPPDLSGKKEKIIYYYSAKRDAQSGFYCFTLFFGQNSLKREQLWLLVNRTTGVVEDYVYRSGYESN